MDSIKTVNDIRQILSEEVMKIRNGESSPAALNAISNVIGKILNSIKLEIEYNKALGLQPKIDFIPTGSEKIGTLLDQSKK